MLYLCRLTINEELLSHLIKCAGISKCEHAVLRSFVHLSFIVTLLLHFKHFSVSKTLKTFFFPLNSFSILIIVEPNRLMTTPYLMTLLKSLTGKKGLFF